MPTVILRPDATISQTGMNVSPNIHAVLNDDDDNIPTGAITPGGSIQSFALYMGGSAYNDGPNDWYPKGTGQFAYSGYGGGAGTWDDINDFAQDTVSLTYAPGYSGSGTGAEVVCRFEAYPGGAGYGNAVNTRYKILAFSNMSRPRRYIISALSNKFCSL